MFKVVTFGSASQDNFVKISKEACRFVADPQTGKEIIGFEHNAKIPVEEAASYTGGGALNTCLAFKRLGISPIIVTAVGWDNFGQIILEKLRDEGISREFVLHLQGVHSAFSTILTTHKGDRTAFVYSGANDHITKDLLPNLKKLGKAEWFVVSHLRGKGADLLIDIFAMKEKNPQIRIAWNPGSTQLQMGVMALKKFLTQTEVFLVNKEEAELLLAKKHSNSIKDLAEEIRKTGPEVAVVTDGSNGAVAATAHGLYKATEFPSEVINTTGAGDSFFAGLVGGLQYTQNIEKALLFGSVNAASTISHLGAQNGHLSKEEIEERISQHTEFRISRL